MEGRSNGGREGGQERMAKGRQAKIAGCKKSHYKDKLPRVTGLWN